MTKQCLLCEIMLNQPFTESCASVCFESDAFGLFRGEQRDSACIGGAVDTGCDDTSANHPAREGIRNDRVEWDDPIQ